MNSISLTGWSQLIITLLTIAAGFAGIWWQVRRQWLAHSAVLLVSLEEQFRSKEFLKAREKLAHEVQLARQKIDSTPKLVGYWAVISFYDNLGAMVHRGALDKELVWRRFGWRITRTYFALSSPATNFLTNTREYYRESSMYEEFEWLAKKMMIIYERQKIRVKKDNAIEEYLEQELNLLEHE